MSKNVMEFIYHDIKKHNTGYNYLTFSHPVRALIIRLMIYHCFNYKEGVYVVA